MRSIIDNKAIENIILEHILKMNHLEEETCEVLKVRVDHLITRLLLRINQNLKNMKDIKAYDRLYYHIEEMKVSYEVFLKSLNTKIQYIEDSEVSDLFIGVRGMVISFLDSIPSKSDNPITYERMVLISAAILKIKQFWLTLLEEEFDCDLGNNISEERLQAYMNKAIREFFFKGMFTSNQMLDESILLLSNFEEGKKYQEYIKEEVHKISTIILKQKDLVESQLTSDAQRDIVGGLMGELAKIYDHSLEVLSPLGEDPKILGSAAEIIHMDEVEALINAQENCTQDQLKPLYSKASQVTEESVTELYNIVDGELKQIAEEVVHKVNRKAADNQGLSKQITQVFTKLVSDLKAVDVAYKTPEGQVIADGITNTMALKLESLEEMSQAYKVSKLKLAGDVEIYMTDKKEQFVGQAEKILEDILVNNDQVLTKVQKRFFDGVEAIQNKDFKFDMAYLKNQLLFELRTFEELIEHSLKKLIELEDDNAKAITDLMLKAMSQARDILLAHSIDLIVAKPHDQFDAKHHEAIFAEEVEGFDKGEIVKNINVGYMKNDTIIIRASIMAAR